jgi:hypothetical protein
LIQPMHDFRWLKLGCMAECLECGWFWWWIVLKIQLSISKFNFWAKKDVSIISKRIQPNPIASNSS